MGRYGSVRFNKGFDPDFIPGIAERPRSLNEAREGDRTFLVPERPKLWFEDGTLRVVAGDRTLSAMMPEIREKMAQIRGDGGFIRRIVFYCTNNAAETDWAKLKSENFERSITEEQDTCMLAFVRVMRCKGE